MAWKALTPIGLAVTLLGSSGCASQPAQKLLPAPAGTPTAAAQYNVEGIQAYDQGQWERAKQRFEAAIQASPELAEAHYNLGLALYKLGNLQEGDKHFMKAANLAPGHKVIWDSPPLRNVYVPSKSVEPSDGHFGHRH
ncbi:MAG: tetratricopeptide repeat protein [Nitrospirota bacterium]